MTLTPTLLWAQTKDDLFLTVELTKPSDVKVDLTDDAFKFHATKDGKSYEFDFKFFKPVKASEYKKKDQRFLEFKVPKSEPASWTTLNSDGKKHFIKCNWDKWVDSDAEADDLDNGFGMPDFGDFDMNGLGGMDGMGDMDDDLDDLEDTEDAEEESHSHKSPHCKNANCKCDPCQCTPEKQCSEGTCNTEDCKCDPCDCSDAKQCGEGTSKSSKDVCCDPCECKPDACGTECCTTKECAEKCPC